MGTSNSKMYIDNLGTKRYKNSKGDYHRLDGPAIEDPNGDKYWYKEGRYHRLDGPAIEFKEGDKFWCKEGKPHRVDGPTIECINGNKEWYLLDKELEKKELNSWMIRISKFI